MILPDMTWSYRKPPLKSQLHEQAQGVNNNEFILSLLWLPVLNLLFPPPCCQHGFDRYLPAQEKKSKKKKTI